MPLIYVLLVAALVGKCSGQPVTEPSPLVPDTPSPVPEVISPKPKPSALPKANASLAPTKPAIDPFTPAPTPKLSPTPESKVSTPIRDALSGSCDCPYDTDKRGRSCGGRSAYSRPGGASPKCYSDD